jgi:hypothetical protein
VPSAVFSDVADGEIATLRIHGFASGLQMQLAAEVSMVARPL